MRLIRTLPDSGTFWSPLIFHSFLLATVPPRMMRDLSMAGQCMGESIAYLGRKGDRTLGRIGIGLFREERESRFSVSCPRVNQVYPAPLEVCNVPSSDCSTMGPCNRGDLAVRLGDGAAGGAADRGDGRVFSGGGAIEG